MVGNLGDEDDGMNDVSDEGGVPLESYQVDVVLTAETLETGPQEMRTIYFQHPTVFVVPDAQLWRLPSVDLVSTKNKQRLKALVGEGPGFVFNTCKIIRKNWDCTPTEALPIIFHESTPYSLALLLGLRILSSRAKKDHSHVHTLLHREWERRISTLDIGPPLGARSYKTTRPAEFRLNNSEKANHCETVIQENIYGITLADIQSTQDAIKREGPRISAKQAAKMRRQDLSGGRVEASEMVTPTGPKAKRKGKKPNRPTINIDWEHEQAKLLAESRESIARRSAHAATVQHPPNSDRVMSLDDVRAARLAEKLDYPHASHGALDTQPPATDDAASAYTHLLNKQQRNAYQQMSDMMDGRLRTREVRSQKRLQRTKTMMQHRDDSAGQAGFQPNILPSARFDIGALPSLGAKLGSTLEGELVAATDVMGLERLGQQALPSTRNEG